MSEKSFADVLKELSKPFAPQAVQFRAGATNREKTKAQALAYVDTRDYYDRLDEVVGGEWTVKVEPIGTGALKIALTIMGVTREEVGEASPEDANTYTSAYAQAFKRACASFGLGRYLYRLPKWWVAYDAQSRKLLEKPALPKWAIPEGVAYVPPLSEDEKERVAADRGLPVQPRRSNRNGQDPADVVVKFGKYRGKTLGQILAEDEGYVRWLAEESTNDFIASRARAVLEQAETAKAEDPKDLPVAAAPEGAKVNGNGHNGNGAGAPPPPPPEPPFDFDDDIPF